MATIHTHSTNLFYKDVKIMFDKDSNTNTSMYEPIEKNRDKLIETMMPMVMKMSRDYAQRYGSRIELNDCINAGMLGAIEATDLYIRAHKEGNNTAKLSTYAHSWIKKRLNDYAHNNLTILSASARSMGDAVQNNFVLSGNETKTEEGMTSEYFETSNEENLMVIDDDSIHELEQLSNKLFKNISKENKTILFLNFGIGVENKLSFSEIAEKLNKSIDVIIDRFETTIKTIKENFTTEEKDILFDLLSNKEIGKLKIWNI